MKIEETTEDTNLCTQQYEEFVTHPCSQASRLNAFVVSLSDTDLNHFHFTFDSSTNGPLQSSGWLGFIITAIILFCCCLGVFFGPFRHYTSLNFSLLAHSLSHTPSLCVPARDLAVDSRHVLASSVPAFLFVVKRKCPRSRLLFVSREV